MKFERNIEAKPDDADIRAALERVVASREVGKSPQLVSFLRFVVAAELAGQGRQIKAYTIATDALGRDARFDPQADLIVRVEAGRLRRALEHYYETEGRNDPVVIDMPRGSYVPSFRPNRASKGVLAHARLWRREAFDTLVDHYRLVLLIAVVATVVSTFFDATWIVLPKLLALAGEALQQATY
jgi:hypothetical protein